MSNAVHHVTLPCALTATATPLRNETIGAFLRRTRWATHQRRKRAPSYSFRLPTICVVNGQPVRQREWSRRRIKAADRVEFWSRPWGGPSGSSGGPSTGKQIAGIVALIAIAVLAPYAAGAFFTAGSLAYVGTVAAITVAGGILALPLPIPERFVR